MSTDTNTETEAQRRGRRLGTAGWVLFGAALVLPAIGVKVMDGTAWMSGWECLTTTYGIAWETVTGAWTGSWGEHLYYTALAMANTLLLASPVLSQLFRRDLRRLHRFGVVQALLAALTLSYLAVGIGDFVGVGTYAWIASFALMAAGTLLQSRGRGAAVITRQPAQLQRTEEEIAALRELEEYIRGSNSPMAQPASEVEETAQIRPVNRSARRHRPPAHSRAARAWP